MGQLIKIKEIVQEYGVSARTLRYYEEMGLIESCRGEEYAYRMYDDAAVSRLQKILVLRRLNIAVRDIKRILDQPGTDAVLEALERKTNDIDEEIAVLSELRQIVLEFIREIESLDLSVSENVKLLYDKAKSLESRLIRSDYDGNTANVNRLIELSEKLKKLPDVRVYEIPACQMVASRAGMFGESALEEFDAWFSQFPRGVFPKDYLTFNPEQNGFVWMYMYTPGMEYPDSFSLIDFPGGLYAVASGVDADDTVYANAHKAIEAFIEDKGCYERDPSRAELGNVITPPAAREAMGYNQMDYWVPIRVKSETL